jgi:hypothetical protein
MPASPKRCRRTSCAMPLKLHLHCHLSLATTAAPHHHHALDAARAPGPPPQTTTLPPAPGRSSHARTSHHRCRHRSRQLTLSQPPPRDRRQQPQLPSASHCRSRCTPPWRRNPADVRVSSRCATVELHQGRCHTTMAPHRPLGDAQCCATQPRRRCHTRGRPSASAQSSSAPTRLAYP